MILKFSCSIFVLILLSYQFPQKVVEASSCLKESQQYLSLLFMKFTDTDFKDCSIRCCKKDSCNFWTFGNETCFLHSQNSGLKEKQPGFESGEKGCPPIGNVIPINKCLKTNKIYEGVPYSSLPEKPDYVACSRECQNSKKCHYWSYSKKNCKLFTEDGQNFKNDQRYISGAKDCPEADFKGTC